ALPRGRRHRARLRPGERVRRDAGQGTWHGTRAAHRATRRGARGRPDRQHARPREPRAILMAEASGAGTARVAWVDGALVPRDEARVSIDDFGLRYGVACFETMLARGSVVFRLDAHLDRLERGLRAMRADPPVRDALVEAVQRTL